MSVRNGILPPSAMRVLAAIAYHQQHNKRLTFRGLMETLRLKSTNALTQALAYLRETGLVELGPSSQGPGHGCAALAVRCRFIPADQLGKEQP